MGGFDCFVEKEPLSLQISRVQGRFLKGISIAIKKVKKRVENVFFRPFFHSITKKKRTTRQWERRT